MGNMTGRNGDTLVYNAQNKLQRIETIGGDKFEYIYDHSGMRIKKTLQNSNTTTYSFGNFYEIHRSPGQQEKHTMYVIGVDGDMVAQYSRPDAILVNQMASSDFINNPFCNNLNINCNTYWKNRLSIAFVSFLEETNIYIDGKLKNGHRSLPWLVLLGFLFLVVYKTRDVSIKFNSSDQNLDIFSISILPILSNYHQRQIPRYGTAILIVILSFTSTAGCFPLMLGGAEGESGTPIWLIGLGHGIPADTPAVGNPLGSGSNSGSSPSGNARVSGMYFFQPDHLGSITMITDGNGNVLAGGERGGKSHITYKPYGEILRTDSYGPDITKFKSTGQEEDSESGLYYYKSRYYDASLARFISSDGYTFPEKNNGMNRMMYVEGNPIKFSDKYGNKISQSWAFAATAYFFAKDNPGFNNDIQRMILVYQAYKKGRSNDRNSRHAYQNWDISKGFDRLKKTNFEDFVLTTLAIVPGGIFMSAFIKKTLNGKRKADKQADKDYYYDTINAINCGKGGTLEGNPICVPILNNYVDRHGVTVEGAVYNVGLTNSTAIPCGTGGSVGVGNPAIQNGNTLPFFNGWPAFVNKVISIIQGFKFSGDEDKQGCTENI
ncbi:RHS repeat-associated core domain-containing protein [Leptospira selangorensis]|uniref:RHS repeat-associated core domain-containing protein n=2 Tax=Leptospira selangorensis TaxID=2484982 RepID=A0ABY2NHT7_9LEPT|nr:RHS repeat-associated core domain-containing protein [Leptospira selangorensis]